METSKTIFNTFYCYRIVISLCHYISFILLIHFNIYCRVTDLIVAAPFYFNKAEGGAVYIYTTLDICKTVKDNEKCSPVVKLVGHEESRFLSYFYIIF